MRSTIMLLGGCMEKVIYLGVIILLLSVITFMIGGALFSAAIATAGAYGLVLGIVITCGSMAIGLNINTKVKGE